MSTILKALRKLEEDKAAAGPPGPLHLDGTSRLSSAGLNQLSRRSRLPQSLVMAVTVFLVLVVSIYFYLHSGDLGRQKSTMTGDHFVASSPVRNSMRSEPTSSEPIVAEASTQTGRSPSSTPAETAEKSTLKRQSASESPLPETQAAPQRVAEEPDKQDKVLPTAPLPPVQSPQARGGIKTYADVPRLTDGRLKIHAIAWSAMPEKCLAVINSSVVHEGDSVDGFVVLAIEQEAVILREKGGSTWRLNMGLR